MMEPEEDDLEFEMMEFRPPKSPISSTTKSTKTAINGNLLGTETEISFGTNIQTTHVCAESDSSAGISSSKIATDINEDDKETHANQDTNRKSPNSDSVKKREQTLATLDVTALVLSGSTVALAASGGVACAAFPIVAVAAAAGAAYIAATGATSKKNCTISSKASSRYGDNLSPGKFSRRKRKKRRRRSSTKDKTDPKIMQRTTMDDLVKKVLDGKNNWWKRPSKAQ